MANDWKKTARGQALEVLEEVFQEGAYSNIALNAHLSKSQLTDKDKALVTEIVYGTLARKITLEWILAHVIEDRDKLEPWVYDLLLLSLYQLAYLDKIPAHAVVNDAVAIAKNRGNKKGAEKLVNAVLRKLSSQPLPNPSQIKRVNKRYSVQYSLPVWLVKKLIDQYGEDRALAIFQSLFVRNKASVRVTDASRLEEIEEATGAERSVLSLHQVFPADSFDKILVDAPCSGIGLIRRKPDIKYNKDLQDFESLKAVQLDILSSVCQTLRKGGIITYSTCTIIAEENQEVIQAFLESHPDFEQVALDHPCKDIVVNGCLAITPEQYLTDGFFIAQLRKKA
ncbi:16S rRNA methyltransferase [Streptococcus salivarius]|uniref:transcription antitermination factor NusB n=1 Tax=Streptococcus salivarius TaxID=1304 RepID=UPI00076308D4|nr:transcription antitermination factor NusB [Streptococcus salivarius]AMB83767.1 16S rRNA methyltransferase [Streptococcus salivarius]